MSGQPGDGTSQILLSCRRPQFQSKQGILAQLGDDTQQRCFILTGGDAVTILDWKVTVAENAVTLLYLDYGTSKNEIINNYNDIHLAVWKDQLLV